MYAKINNVDLLDWVVCANGEILIINIRSIVVLDNQLKQLGRRDDNVIVCSLPCHKYAWSRVRIEQSSRKFWLRYTHHGSEIEYLFSVDHTCHSLVNGWKDDTYRIADTLWRVPKRRVDLFKLPKFKCLVIAYHRALTTWVNVSDLHRIIYRLTCELLMQCPDDYCECVE